MSRPPFDEDGYCEDGVYKEHYCVGCEGTYIKRLEQKVNALLEAVQEAVEAERLNRSTTRNYRGLYETKKRPRHHRFENAIDKLAALIQEKGE